MIVSETKKNKKRKYTLLTSKIYYSYEIYKIARLFIFFILKNQMKYKLVFFYILALIFLKYPTQVLINKKKRKPTSIMGFYCKNGLNFLYNLFLIHITTLYYMFTIKSNFFKESSYIIFNNMPLLDEVETLFEKNSEFFDYFLDYKFLFFFKFKTYSKICAENELRCIYRFPIKFL